MKSTLLFLILYSVISTAKPISTIHRGNGSEPDSLNIHLAQGINSHNVLLDIYEGLMTFNAQGQVINGVTNQIEVSEDLLQWKFMLKPEAKWSDGQPVLPSDFINAWKRAYDPKLAAPYRHLFDNMTKSGKINASAENTSTLVINLNQPDPGFLQKLVLPIFYPLPGHSDNNKVSNGAYHLKEWLINEKITLSKNQYFHHADDVKVDQIVYWVTDNQNSELLRFRADELDITETIPDHKIDWLTENYPEQLKIAPYYGTFFLGLNLNDKHLKNKSLRKALHLAIDRNILVEKVLKTGQKPAYQIIPPKEIKAVNTENHLSQAKRYLEQSGFNVNSERLELLYNSSNNQKKVALAIAAMWRQNLGIKCQLKNQEWKVFVNTRKGSNKQVFRSGWIADYYDPFNFLELFRSDSHFNFYAFKHSEYDQLMNQTNTSDPTELKLLINNAEQILADELPVIPLYHYVSRHLVKQNVKGFENNLMDKHLSRYLRKP